MIGRMRGLAFLMALPAMAWVDGAAQAPAGATPEFRTGRFEFRYDLPQGGRLEGTYVATQDTVLLELHGGDCRPMPPPKDPVFYVWNCREGKFFFDRNMPGTRAYVEAVMTTTESQPPTCVREGRDASGRVVCLEFSGTTTQRDNTRVRRVRLTVTPIR
jgi:hypothetical protein